jgi:HD-like signal output (HDOD) protein
MPEELSNDALRALDGLPTLPVVALRIGEVVHSKNASVQQVADVLRSDPATSAKLLRLVNSPYFGIPGGVSDVARAIPFIGFNTLYQLVLSITVFDTLRVGVDGIDPRALWTHSLTVATAAREIAQEVRFSDPGACFTAGEQRRRVALAVLLEGHGLERRLARERQVIGRGDDAHRGCVAGGRREAARRHAA